MSELLDGLRARGFAVRAEAGKVIVTPGSRLTADDRRGIAAARDAILARLGEEERVAAANAPVEWSQASAARVIAEVVREVRTVAERFGAVGLRELVPGAVDLLADGLNWLAGDIRRRDGKRAGEVAEWLGWLAREIVSWSDGKTELPPREALA